MCNVHLTTWNLILHKPLNYANSKYRPLPTWSNLVPLNGPKNGFCTSRMWEVWTPPPDRCDSSLATFPDGFDFEHVHFPLSEMKEDGDDCTEYTECQAFCPVTQIWSPHPLTHKLVLLPPPFMGPTGEKLSFAGEGWEDPIHTKGQSLWYTLCMNFLYI
jgi:hypothetical protein